jgi:hypothetical protein
MKTIVKTVGAAGFSILVLLSITLLPIKANAALEIKSPDGTSSIKFGLLGQFQAESLTTANGQDTSKDLYLRRFRILVGGNINEKLSFFAETDNPNLGKFDSATNKKGAGDTYIQDAYATYSFGNEFMIDAGMLLFPVSHHSGQSAASLLGIDYGPYAFVWSTPTDCRVGRDYGVQARGYLGDNHFEYRVGVFQGVRGVNSTNPQRFMARAVYYPFQNEPGYFYAGSYLGARKVLGIGVSIDSQDDYKAYGADVFFDYPLANKDVVTAQVDYTYYDGKNFLLSTDPVTHIVSQSLPKQNVIFGEAQYYFESVKIAPFVQVTYESFDKETLKDKHFMQAGIAYYIKGQNANIKLGVGRFGGDHLKNQTQVLLRMQVFMF